MRIFKTEVRQMNEAWWFLWWNIGGLSAEGIQGPFESQENARRALEAFKAKELAKHPDTTTFVE